MNLPLISGSRTNGEVHLFVGTGANVSIQEDHRVCTLTIKRLHRILTTGAIPIIINPSHPTHINAILNEFKSKIKVPIQIIDRKVRLNDLTTLGRNITSGVIDRLFVNLGSDQLSLVKPIYEQCIKLRIPINTYQQPEYSTFTLLPTYTDPKGSGLQIAVTTNGKGYILDERIKRNIVNNLPPNISEVISNMGFLRDQLILQHNSILLKEKYIDTHLSLPRLGYGLDNDPWDSHKFNQLIKEFDMTQNDQRHRRCRWLSQIMEYYPLSKLDKITLSDLELLTDKENVTSIPTESVSKENKKGKISLVGSGPGSISMLTLGALHEIKTADLILSDKLVPQEVLDLIPTNTKLIIAKKFPGNAEMAQNEFLTLGLKALRKGLHVIRLKQGDPYIFGRGGEEYLWFKEKGFTPLVLPGISSSLASTVVAQIPATLRGVADQVLICTGTGRKGAIPEVPEYVSSRTTIFLMALHRADILQKSLLDKKWDPEVPLAIIERASCPDQRVTRTKLKYLSQTVEEIGSRPPGLIIVGPTVNHLTDHTSAFIENYTHIIDEGFHDVKIDSTKVSIAIQR